MKKTKLISIIFFLLAISYTSLAYYAHPLDKSGTKCNNQLIKRIIPRDSGCFYSAEFQTSTTQAQILNEKNRLDAFIKKEGMSPQIYWYRYTLFRKFPKELSLSTSDVNQAFQQFISSDPRAIHQLIEHLQYLTQNTEHDLAQASIDSYCGKYLAKDKHAIYQILKNTGIEKKTILSLELCRSRINP